MKISSSELSEWNCCGRDLDAALGSFASVAAIELPAGFDSLRLSSGRDVGRRSACLADVLLPRRGSGFPALRVLVMLAPWGLLEGTSSFAPFCRCVSRPHDSSRVFLGAFSAHDCRTKPFQKVVL